MFLERTFVVVALLGLSVACASKQKSRLDYYAEEGITESRLTQVKKAPPPVDLQRFDAKAYVAAFPSARECEQAARDLRQRAPDQAWEVLKLCVEKNDFTLLKVVLDGSWDAELQKRRDASILIARVIARRGGDVDGDLALARAHRIPLFSLGTVLGSPTTYKGHLMLLRARVDDLKTQRGKPVVMLTEMGLGSRGRNIQVGTEVRGDLNLTFHQIHHENVMIETGLEAMGKLAKADPFLVQDRQYVILGRFEGVRLAADSESDDEEDEDAQRLAVLQVINYWEPAHLLLE